jgi:hypothetical protein
MSFISAWACFTSSFRIVGSVASVRLLMMPAFGTEGVEPLASTPEEYAADIDREEAKWSIGEAFGDLIGREHATKLFVDPIYDAAWCTCPNN